MRVPYVATSLIEKTRKKPLVSRQSHQDGGTVIEISVLFPIVKGLKLRRNLCPVFAKNGSGKLPWKQNELQIQSFRPLDLWFFRSIGER